MQEVEMPKTCGCDGEKILSSLEDLKKIVESSKV